MPVIEPKPKGKSKSKLFTVTNVAVGFCLDETGSMGRSRQATINGFNEFLADTKTQPGKTRLSLTKFSDRGAQEPMFRPVHEGADIQDVPELTDYNPYGNTPLFDAIGYTIKQLESWLSADKDKWSVLFVIQTDGEENASREYTREKIFELIRRKEAEGWRFIYLGVDQDEYAAETASTSMGLTPGSSQGYNRHQQTGATASVGQTMSAYRSSGGSMSSPDLAATNKKATAAREAYPPDPIVIDDGGKPPKSKKRPPRKDHSNPNF